jgi:hypothetical protein
MIAASSSTRTATRTRRLGKNHARIFSGFRLSASFMQPAVNGRAASRARVTRGLFKVVKKSVEKRAAL